MNTLDDKHRDELHASGLTDATITAAGIYSAEGETVGEILKWKPKTHSHGRAMVFPFRAFDGTANGFARVKPDHPRTKDGKVIKYESPMRLDNRAYFGPGLHDLLRSAERIVITEGEKKALAALQLGIPTIGLTGVWSWQRKRLRDDNGHAFGQRKLIEDLATIQWKGRDVVVVFDSDAADNRSIQLAEYRLAEMLTKLGAAVRIARIPPNGDSKVGLDDFLVASGESAPDAFRRVLEAAEIAETPESFGVMDWARALLDDAFTYRGKYKTLRWWRDEFYRWTGTKYARVADTELQAAVLSWLDSRMPDARPRLASEVVACLASLCRVEFSIEQPAFIDSDSGISPSDIIAFSNGLVNVSNVGGDLTILDHTPQWFSPVALDYPFDPAANCPGWEAFLTSTLGADADNNDCIDLLQRWFGYLLTSDTSRQKFLLMIGVPRSGKGVIVRTIERVFGPDNCTTPTLSSLGATFGLWPLVGKSIALFPDAHMGRKTDSTGVLETIKSISGEDPQNVNRKHLSILQNVRIGVRFVITANELMHFSDASGALSARMLVLPFSNTFAGKEDRTLETRLRAEAPGILNWALRGLYRLREMDGFITPRASQEIFDSFKRMSSPILAFVEDACDVGPDKTAWTTEAWSAYRAWARRNGREAGSQATFGERLRTCGQGVQRKRAGEKEGRGYFYAGISLNKDGEALVAEWAALSATKED